MVLSMSGIPLCLLIVTFSYSCFASPEAKSSVDPTPIASVLPSSSILHQSRVLKLVDTPSTILTYHNGPILSGEAAQIPVFVIWYGRFSARQQSIVRDFFSSFHQAQKAKPSVYTWWSLTQGYKNASGSSIASTVSLAGEIEDRVYSKGKTLTNADLETLVLSSLAKFPIYANAIFFVLTASDVIVEDFCMNSCASHFSTSRSAASKNHNLPFAWVGNSATQCPGECAWPFARAQYGPPGSPLLPPNGDVGMDGMIINIASMLAGTATNPWDTGYYQGDASAPLEAATACAGIYGPGAYPGFPGALLINKRTGASYNANGADKRTFLLPALWNPSTLLCTPPPT